MFPLSSSEREYMDSIRGTLRSDLAQQILQKTDEREEQDILRELGTDGSYNADRLSDLGTELSAEMNHDRRGNRRDQIANTQGK